MNVYIVLLRGINVGGKNKLPMADLRQFCEQLGCTDVHTYIQSGNIILHSNMDAKELKAKIEAGLPKQFQIDSSIIKVLVLTPAQLRAVIANKPKGFGEQPDKYHNDVIFLMDIDVADAIQVFSPRVGVDSIWPGENVIYSQRLSTQRTKSRLGKIVGTKAYQSMTIRNWRTTTKLLELINGY